jgi:hypothetical protein
MLDLIMVALIAVCFALVVAYARFCGRVLSARADRDIVK